MSVSVTGWALRTPLGTAPEQVGERLLRGEHAIQSNPRFPSAGYACSLAAPLAEEPEASPHARVLSRVGLAAFQAAVQAFRHAGARSGERLGLFAAVGGLRVQWDDLIPALCGQRIDLRDSYQRGFKLLHPFWMLKHLSNNTHALLAAEIGARGDGVTLGGANAGAQALVAAEQALAVGAVDQALVVAYDCLIEPEVLVEMAARGALTEGELDAWRGPYDQAANGAVPGEAAAAVVLEHTERATPSLCRLSAVDAADGEPGEPRADTLAALVERLGNSAELVDGAALCDPARDSAERHALARLVAPDTRLTAVTAGMGRLGAATSLVQAIVLASLLRRGQLPAIAGLRQAAKGPLCPQTRPEFTRVRAALAVSAGAPGLAGALRVTLD